MKKDHLGLQIFCLCVTLILIAITVFVFHSFGTGDYILIVLAVLELIGIIITLVKRKKAN